MGHLTVNPERDDDTRLRALENFMNRSIPWQERVDGDLYNHGKEGLKTQFDKFVAAHIKEEEMRKSQHEANKTRLNLIIGLLGILIALISAAPAIKSFFRSDILPLPLPNIFSIHRAQPQDAENTSLPSTYSATK